MTDTKQDTLPCQYCETPVTDGVNGTLDVDIETDERGNIPVAHNVCYPCQIERLEEQLLVAYKFKTDVMNALKLTGNFR